MEEKRRVSWEHMPHFKLSRLKNTIGLKIMGLVLAVVFFGTAVFEIFYVRSLYDYYYDNVSGALASQARYDAELFYSYVSDEDFKTVVLENKNQFFRGNPMQVQLLNNDGKVLYDSSGSGLPGSTLDTEDVKEAQENRTGTVVGMASYTDEHVMSLSYPLRSPSNQVGILRLTTSLTPVDELIKGRVLLSLLFSLVVLLLSGFWSFLITRSIVKPIRALTQVAHKYSDGQYAERADESSKGEIGELARTMNAMSDNIAQKENLKNDFISSVSHELRTPLTSIKGWAVTLQNENIKPDIMDEGLKIIEKESERLGSMVEDLLDFSRFSAGRLQLDKVSFDLVEMSNRLLRQMTPRANEKGVNLNYSYSDKSVVVVADEDRIKQVLINVLDNAIKFTDEGGTIYLEIQTDLDWVTVTVTDTGIGISEDEIAFVTEKFWKGSSSQSHSGLGLSISEEIAKAHGGSLKIKSRLGTGTSVSLLLPLPQPKEEA